MANPEQVAIIKQGVEPWNEWREKNPGIEIDLRKADLGGADLRGANLSGAQLSLAILVGADLIEADLRKADLEGAFLKRADLSRATLIGATLADTDLVEANLSGTDLSLAHILGGLFDKATLIGADLSLANLNTTFLSGADLSGAILNYTAFLNVDLSEVKGLEEVKHVARSSIGIDSIYRSKGKIPEVFLRGCGVPENMITFMHSLAGNPSAIEFYSCFISYSSKDEAFAKRVHADLQSKGVRVWFAPEDLKIGDRFRTRIDEAIKVYDKLLIVLSENSIQSDWVEKEVEAAFEKEREQKRPMLFPVRLDDGVMHTEQAWAADIRRTRHIGDFSKWKEHDSYQAGFERLLRDLKATEKPSP